MSDTAASQQAHWRSRASFARAGNAIEQFLATAEYDGLAWLVAGFALGIAAWFVLPGRSQWMALIAGGVGLALGACAAMQRDGRWPWCRAALIGMPLALAAGCALVWAKSAWVGAAAIPYPSVVTVNARILARDAMPAAGKVRLLLALRPDALAGPIRARVSVPDRFDLSAAQEGAIVRIKARLMPPSAPLWPGAYDAARRAWFDGVAATGAALGPLVLVREAADGGSIDHARHALAERVHARLPGAAGGIAVALASGERGALSASDEAAMRDAGLTHLLSVSGLHVSAVVGGAYWIVLRLLALWPWLALRVRLPLIAGGAGALAGIAYTLLTGAQVPTLRSCVGALLVLAAVAFGRQPMSLRLLALAGFVVLLLWPESVVGPSFQMSFGAVLAIVALHQARPARAFLAARDEGWLWRHGRQWVMLLLTGLVIELALMPITFFHFHRGGVYGALANLVAIPLTTVVVMPLLAGALALDAVVGGLSTPLWQATAASLDGLLGLARAVAARPDAVTVIPTMGEGVFGLFLAGMIWLALWRGTMRAWGIVPALAGAVALAMARPADVLISPDAHHIGMLVDDGAQLVVLGQGRSTFYTAAMLEAEGQSLPFRPLPSWQGARCNTDFCRVVLRRPERDWTFLLGRNDHSAATEAMVVACAGVDVVIARTPLPAECHPRHLKVDKDVLHYAGGMALYLAEGRVLRVADSQGQHPWWRAPSVRPQTPQ
ncbi:ComEC/Rec2 family competence protein [Novosphingobium ovatum]|uniref:ComEC/Rec2 family competence protein n=1 Tax=Novosphingobium ovatum TaxID=1908523 RepID=UPI0029FEED95|nr:ComEC/Rec2 family competence protein [Novosphingobium ovatum]